MSDGHNNTEEDMEDGKYVRFAYLHQTETLSENTSRCDAYFFKFFWVS